MVNFKSEKATIAASTHEVFAFLSKAENYKPLMPSNVSSFTTNGEQAILKIDGIGEVILAITESTEPTKIVMKPQNKVPFDFYLWWEISETTDNQTVAQVFIDADLNFMMKMMAEGVLKKFLNAQVDKLSNAIEESRQ